MIRVIGTLISQGLNLGESVGVRRRSDSDSDISEIWSSEARVYWANPYVVMGAEVSSCCIPEQLNEPPDEQAVEEV